MNQFFKLSQREFVNLGFVFIAWRTVLFLWSWLANQVLTYEPSFPYAYTLLTQYRLPQWLYSWANFDGVHYLTIADRGYSAADLIQAFFPIYPMLMSILSVVTMNSIISGLLISNGALIGCLLVLYALVRQNLGAEFATKTTLALLLFPTSFFFGAVYSESLFLLTVLLAFYCAHTKHWFLASVLVAIATATRIVGIFLIPALLVELYLQFKPPGTVSMKSLQAFFTQKFRDIICICLGILGIGGYMLYLYLQYSDPLYFWHVQSEFGAGREEGIILLPQVVWRYLKILSTVSMGREWFIYLQELLFGLVPLGLILYYWLKEKLVKPSWAVFSIGVLLLPPLTGNFSSMARYALVAFPLYIIIARWMSSRTISRIILTLSGILLLLNLLLFIQGYWVA